MPQENTSGTPVEPTTDPDSPASAVTPPDEDSSEPEVDPDRALDALGIGETRTAQPDENPLEDKLDNLLDGIE